MPLWASLGLILLLFFVGGVFSAAEMALVSLRESQIVSLARRGSRGRAIEQLTSNPNRFLSAVQIGVTLAGFLSSAFGSDSLAGEWVAPLFARWGLGESLAKALAVIVVTALISFGSIVISELFSKRLALQRPEAIALALAPTINSVARFFRPLIWALGFCTDLLVRLVGMDPRASKEAVSDDELRTMVTNADSLGADQKHIVDEVFSAGEHSMREVMVPRTEVEFLPGDMTVEQAVAQVQNSPHSRYPVIDDSPDRVLGFLHVRDLMGPAANAGGTRLRRIVRPVLRLPETVRVPRALSDMRRDHSHLAVVLDEYSGTAGIVTLEDLVEELIGDITDEYDVIDPETRRHRLQRDIDGMTTLEDFAGVTGHLLPEGPYDTLAGYFMARFGAIPRVGESITVRLVPADGDADGEADGDASDDPFRMRVTQMDGRRIAWLSVQALETGTEQGGDLAGESAGRPAGSNAAAMAADAQARAQLAAGLQHADDQAPGVLP
ncbi:hemolysin family protein [uncultured Propionibacterium sp.]|uniref:hemolysin family protein n=1 Tax=uncultured Propionibacterium sp. TaxID=218066 RepID=UPI0029302829|nr:hemolysin family protein [uncultured Propionibacterium sp.]